MATPSPSGSSAESLFAAWLARHEAGEEADFDSLCREHPGQVTALRELRAQWERLEGIRRQHGLAGSLSERLKSQYGSGADPQVTLEGEERGKPDFSAEILARLAGRGPASTRYRLKGEVAHGGMGAILRVWDEDLRRHLAMKVMLGKGRSADSGATPPADPRVLARFLEEAQVTGQLDHPGIVPVHELGLDAEGRVYFTMKLVKGKTLKEVFDELAAGEGGWTQTRVLGLLLKACEAMAYAHHKGVIHRDLKPANVMVGSYGEVYVMDWGLARILGREDEKDLRVRRDPAQTTSELRSERRERAGETPDSPLYTMDGDVVGTPAYMSPEQAAGRIAEMGPHSDVYAVGAMLYHLLAGHIPYVPPGALLNNYAVWSHVQAGPPRPLNEVAPNAAPELVAICEKAIARRSAERYPDMSALSADLAAFVEGRVVKAYETGAWAEARKWVKRNKPLAASLAAALILAIGGLGAVGYVQAEGRAAERTQRDRADAKTREAEQNLALAQRNEAEAVVQQGRAEAQTAKVLRLSDVKRLQELEQQADGLWPAYPDRIPDLAGWMDRASKLASTVPGHRTTLVEMRDRALAWSNEERDFDRSTHPRAAELAEKKAELVSLTIELDARLEGEARAQAEKRLEEVEPEVQQLTEEVESRRMWLFETPEEQWQHDVLAELIDGLKRLESGLLAEDAITAEHGWSAARRLFFAQHLEAGFSEGGEYDRAWAQALPAIAKRYPGLELNPQMGLLPIGPDPESGLWEFAHLMSGEPAERGVDGKLLLTEEMGVVLVLLPGGTFWMGAQQGDPTGHNYDPQAQGNEGPVHEVELSSFYLSKHELTQGQWARLTGCNPSLHLTGSLAQPVEQVSWHDCMNWLPRFGLQLPSEAQWEYGARGGTETPWWTGAERESLAGAANLVDRHAKEHGGSAWPGHELWLEDGATTHAPVGTYAANGFGLHEVHGNLWELCQDGYDPGFFRRSPRMDPVAPWVGVTMRVIRGGSFDLAAPSARSAMRASNGASGADGSLGVRVAAGVITD